MPTAVRKSVVVIGAGPGLGMSIAQRFGREGYAVALISRTDVRHAGYVASLAEAGIEAASFAADVRDRDRLLSTLDAINERFGTIDVLYYGTAAADLDIPRRPIIETTAEDAREAMDALYPAIDAVGRVLPGMVERGTGGLLFAGGLSSVMPMPALGGLALSAAAMRNYALTLNTALAEKGVYVGNLTIGGLIERGDIYRLVTSQPERFGDVGSSTLDPDAIADTAWDLYVKRDRPEATFSAFV
ncbi:NADP-dependent 3-hydroxy acid dehydrogenase YdfG [Streptosporangium subroseum]|uniref:NADP-dependent 3-hydroxy acid dehydrogenase YdfG n=1 Tax=Streptosporangium subroseum TaxID=106412 RepID=A0A239LLD0_9ACTN|nr:SDR family NAD(P)-dependent oxidoreductase [Streptosporangium subroseum]SNT30623.1 NADP-dependent 3-hydroxy acid dehydrogenase YdfG [Streptosporangium subroseum]